MGGAWKHTSIAIRVGADLPADTAYPTAFMDGDGQPLHCTNKDVLHFGKGQTPVTQVMLQAWWGQSVRAADHHEPESVVAAVGQRGSAVAGVPRVTAGH